MDNLAREYLCEVGNTVDDYEGYCLELCDDILHWLDRKDAQILYFEDPRGRLISRPSFPTGWSYHTALLIDHLVHDAHMEYAMPLPDYLRAMFKNRQIKVSYFLPEKEEMWIRKEALEDDPELAHSLSA